MKNNQYKIATSIWVVFILFQLMISFFSSDDFLSLMGLMQLFFVSSFLFGYTFCLSISTKRIYTFLVFYLLILVGVLHQFYLYRYNNPLGYNPMDATFYNDTALMLSRFNLKEAYQYLSENQDLGDFGYLVILQGIYRLSETNPIILSKLFNILFHLLTCYYLVKVSDILFRNGKLSKILLILYGLNPATVFFISSGLKEPLFALVVVLAFYFTLKAYQSKSFKSLILAGVFILSTGLFRSAYPVFIVFSMIMYSLWNSQGKFKRLKQLGLLVVGLIGIYGAYLFVETELTQKMNYDVASISESRFGGGISSVNYFILFIGGLIGPFPSFEYDATNQINLLQTAGNYIKIFFSYFFIIGSYLILKNKFRLLYVAILFILVNLIVLVALAASLDYRFLYPFMPLYFLVLAYGYFNYDKGRVPTILSKQIYFIAIICLIVLYNLK